MKGLIEIVCVVVIFAAVILFAVYRENESEVEVIQTRDVRAWLAQTSCESEGGVWNACGSACRTTPGDPCVDLCVEYCECVLDEDCPAGFSCQDYVEGVGVCKTQSVIAADEPVEEALEVNEEKLDEKTYVETVEESVNLAVPFTPQAPRGDWGMPYQEACEEASLYMVSRYYEGDPTGLINSDDAGAAIVSIGELTESLGLPQDVTIAELATVAQVGWNYQTRLIENPTVEQIKEELLAVHPVIVPLAGRLLGNPYFTQPGPVYHMLVIRGFTQGGQFITNDPGTYRGEGYLYDFDTIMSAMHDWNGGGEITDGKKIVLVVSP